MSSLVLLPAMAAAVKLRGLGRVQRRLLAAAERRQRRGGSGPSCDAQRAAFLVEAASRRGLWRPNCLQRSLVLWWWLRGRGITADLRIGVRRMPGAAQPEFHAWVELDGRVLNDVEADIATYVAFDRAIAPDGATFS